jgi:hypothetical protein
VLTRKEARRKHKKIKITSAIVILDIIAGKEGIQTISILEIISG